MGEKRTFYNTNRFRISQELFQGIKEVKLSGNEKVYLNQFDEASLKYAKLFVKLSLFRDFPRSILELVSVGGVF